jgi:hypothetical protein
MNAFDRLDLASGILDPARPRRIGALLRARPGRRTGRPTLPRPDLINQGSPLFQNFFGTLDAQGQATATFDPIRPLPPSWAGVNIDFCLVTSPPDFASLPAAVLFVP